MNAAEETTTNDASLVQFDESINNFSAVYSAMQSTLPNLTPSDAQLNAAVPVMQQQLVAVTQMCQALTIANNRPPPHIHQMLFHPQGLIQQQPVQQQQQQYGTSRRCGLGGCGGRGYGNMANRYGQAAAWFPAGNSGGAGYGNCPWMPHKPIKKYGKEPLLVARRRHSK